MRWLVFALVLCASLLLDGCSFSYEWVRHLMVERAVMRRDFDGATSILQKMVQADPDSSGALWAAREGARIAHFESGNYLLAVEFYKHIILRSTDADERKSAQKIIAQIQFESLHNYDQAVIEYERLLTLDHQPEEAFHYRLNLAKSHLQLNNIDQALSEIEILIHLSNSADEAFEANVLKANTLIAAKRPLDAAPLWESIIKQFPERSRKENIALNLVVVYEEMRDFSKAIEILERMRKDYPHPDFLDVRIQRLRERKMNQPGAQGLKR